MKKKGDSVLLGVTGSIAAYKACEITGSLAKNGIDVKVILTKEAMEFVTPLTFQTLSRNKVTTDMFEPPAEWKPVHTSLADSARVIVIAPATANIIGKLANGICDDILSCVVFATKAPVIIAPAMNEAMYKHEIVQQNIARLKKIGYIFVGPVKGHLACGCDDIGHIAKTEDILKEIKRFFR